MKIAVIGAGNMGGAIALGAVNQGVVRAADVVVSDPRESLASEWGPAAEGMNFMNDNAQAVRGADLVIVALKPWLMEEVLGSIAGALDRKNQTVVSIAAGVTFADLKGYLSADKYGDMGLYRVIPNTAISLGKSATFVAKSGTAAEQDAMVASLFGALGEVFDVEEYQMTAVTALASSGIAYALKYIDSAVQGGEDMGIDRDEALKIVLQTMRGAIALLETNRSQPQQEIDKVTTPGGITLKGLEEMARGGFTEAVIRGLLATK